MYNHVTFACTNPSSFTGSVVYPFLNGRFVIKVLCHKMSNKFIISSLESVNFLTAGGVFLSPGATTKNAVKARMSITLHSSIGL